MPLTFVSKGKKNAYSREFSKRCESLAHHKLQSINKREYISNNDVAIYVMFMECKNSV